MPEPQPRRRVTDRDRRAWSDARLNERHEAIDRRLNRLEEFQRVVAQVPGLMEAIRDAQDEQGQDIRTLGNRIDTLFARNFREHESVQSTADKIEAQTAPSRFSKVKDFATFVSVLIVPFLLTYLTIVLAGGAR